MDKAVIFHIFGSLQALEQNIDATKKRLLTSDEKNSPQQYEALLEHEKIVKQMRTFANKLQLEFARGNTTETLRYMNIFYCLNQMVRPEIISSYRTASNIKYKSPSETTSAYMQ
jgi:hypothetical protein